MDRFHKNVSALSELCGAEDEIQLQKIAEGLDERFFAIRDAILQRAEALESAIEQSSQFTDRLDIVLANLDGVAVQVYISIFTVTRYITPFLTFRSITSFTVFICIFYRFEIRNQY